jgi:hypothetical protein
MSIYYPSSDGSPGGSNQQVQYNVSGVFGGMSGVMWDDSLNELTITAQAIDDTPVNIVAASGQTANLTEWQDSAGTVGARITKDGEFSNNGGTEQEQFGASASAAGTYSVAIGSQSSVTGSESAAVGRLATCGGNASVAVGAQAGYLSASSNNCSYIGNNAGRSVTGADNVAVGTSALNAGGSTNNSVVIGSSANSSKTAVRCVVIGSNANAQNNANCVLLGSNATATASNQFVAGSNSYVINDVFFGQGVTNTAPSGYTINGTGGTGTNIAGGDLKLAGGIGTGSGVGGTVIVQGVTTGSSGATANTLVDVATFAGEGTHLLMQANALSDIPLTVKGAASQSANLQEWQDSAGTVMAKVEHDGEFHGRYFRWTDDPNRYIDAALGVWSNTNWGVTLGTGNTLTFSFQADDDVKISRSASATDGDKTLNFYTLYNNDFWITNAFNTPTSDLPIGRVRMSASSARAANTTNVNGGSVYIESGDSATGSGDGGKIVLETGSGTDANGQIQLAPTNPGDILCFTSTAPTAGSGSVMVFGDNAADPTLGANTAGIYGKDVDGVVHPYAVSESGTTVQLTYKEMTLYVVDFETPLTSGDGKLYWRIPSGLDSMSLTHVAAQVGATASTSGTPTIQIARLRFTDPSGARTATDMLSTPITIDVNEWDSKDATTPPVIGVSNSVLEGDLVRVDVDVSGTNTQGLFVTLGFS